jgi:hypothetical protein
MGSVARAAGGGIGSRAAAFAKDAPCIGFALAAAGSHTQVVLEVGHVLAAEAHGAADFAFGNGVADADVHVVLGLLGVLRIGLQIRTIRNTMMPKMSEKSNSPAKGEVSGENEGERHVSSPN